jgi:hypothetical protein
MEGSRDHDTLPSNLCTFSGGIEFIYGGFSKIQRSTMNFRRKRLAQWHMDTVILQDCRSPKGIFGQYTGELSPHEKHL